MRFLPCIWANTLHLSGPSRLYIINKQIKKKQGSIETAPYSGFHRSVRDDCDGFIVGTEKTTVSTYLPQELPRRN